MRIQLSDSEAGRIRKSVRGHGGFQSLLRRLQRQIGDNNILEVSDGDTERIVKYFFTYGQGGFQDRTKPIATR